MVNLEAISNDELEEAVDDLEVDVEDLESVIADLEADVELNEGDIDTLETAVSNLDSDVSSLDSTVSTLESDVEDNSDAVESLPDDIDEVELQTEQTPVEIGGWSGRVSQTNQFGNHRATYEVDRVLSGMHIDYDGGTNVNLNLWIRLADGTELYRGSPGATTYSRDIMFRYGGVEEVEISITTNSSTGSDVDYEFVGLAHD